MSTGDLPTSVQSNWHGFLETYEPLRPDLYRYCRHLCRSPWDAEDLAQDTLMRAFVTLGQMDHEPPNPRAWLFRVASNLWIDRVRQRKHDAGPAELHAPASVGSDPRTAREAAGTLLGQLSPQERAAVVLKDVFELSLDETAGVLATTVGAVKAALHRARGKLVEPAPDAPTSPAPAVLDAFCEAFNAGQLDKLTALLLDTGSVEVVGATTQYGREAARRTVLMGMLFGVEHMANLGARGGVHGQAFAGVLPTPPRVELRQHRGSWLFLHFYQHQDGELARAMTRLELDGDGVTRLRNYFYNPELLAEVCTELGVPFRSNGRCWWKICDPETAQAIAAKH